MIIEQLRLEAINRTLLSSNVYSQRDAAQVQSFLFGNTAIALSEICRIALKYINLDKTLFSMKDDLKESYEYYLGKGRNQLLENNVSVDVDFSGNTINNITISAHPDYLNSLKFINCIERTENCIVINPTDLSTVIAHFNELGLKLTEVKKYLKDKGVSQAYFRNVKKDITYIPDKIALEPVSARVVKVICAPEFQAVVREIRGFKVGKSKHLEIPSSGLMSLYTKLSALARQSNINLDLSDFEKFIDLTMHEGDFNIQASMYGTSLMFKVEYHPIIHETLINIPTMQYIESHATWACHRRYIDKVIDSLKSTNLNIDMDDLYTVRENIEIEFEQTKCELYDFSLTPYMREPWNHQKEGAMRILNERKIILADEMGIGKTYTTILAALSAGLKLGGPIVIVCPSTLKLNWVKEIRKLDKSSSICVSEGDYITNANWIIINYDILDRHSQDIMTFKPKFIAFDESHKLKSVNEQGLPKSKRALHSIVISQCSPYVVSITGTPMPKGPLDLFNQFKLIDHPLSDDYIYFGTHFCNGKPSKNGWDFSGSSNEEELHEILKGCMIRNKKIDCLDLPDKLRTFMPVSVDLAKYNELVQTYMDSKDISPMAYNMVLVGQMKKYLAYAKIPRTIELLESVLENGDSCVVFSDYTFVIEYINQYINQNYQNQFTKKIVDAQGNVREIPIREVSVTLTGKDSSEKKFNKVESFQEGFHKVIVCNMKAGGVGLNMTQANKEIFNDLTWLPVDHFQCEDRIHRGGQTQKVEIVYLIAEGAEIDMKLGDIIEQRSKMSAAIIDGGNYKESLVSVMSGVLKYLEEVRANKRKPGNFVVDEIDDLELFEGLDLSSAEFNDDKGDFSEVKDVTRTSPIVDTMETSKETNNEPDQEVIQNPCKLTLISKEPKIYQYTKVFPENGYTLALQLKIQNSILAFNVLKRDNYTGALEKLNYTKASQINGSFRQVDEVGTHILQHLTKIDNYLTKGNLQYAKGTVNSLDNILSKYIASQTITS